MDAVKLKGKNRYHTMHTMSQIIQPEIIGQTLELVVGPMLFWSIGATTSSHLWAYMYVGPTRNIVNVGPPGLEVMKLSQDKQNCSRQNYVSVSRMCT